MNGKWKWGHRASLLVGLVLLVVGHYLGLFWAPRDGMMGEVQRIMYVHVPSVWMALLAYTFAFGCSVAFLLRSAPKWDALAYAAVQVAVFFNALGLALGMIWGKPTWGAFWSWDPRLTFTLVMFVSYCAYLVLRRSIDDPERRQSWSAVWGIVAYATLPLVWFSVKWFRSLHQLQSSPKTVDPSMVVALRTCAFAFLFLMIWMIGERYLAARGEQRLQSEPVS